MVVRIALVVWTWICYLNSVADNAGVAMSFLDRVLRFVGHIWLTISGGYAVAEGAHQEQQGEEDQRYQGLPEEFQEDDPNDGIPQSVGERLLTELNRDEAAVWLKICMTEGQFARMSIAELKEECRIRGVRVGSKSIKQDVINGLLLHPLPFDFLIPSCLMIQQRSGDLFTAQARSDPEHLDIFLTLARSKLTLSSVL